MVLIEARILAFYQAALRILNESNVPFHVGGAYALARYTGIERHTNDLDVFVKPADAPRVLKHFEEAGYRVENTHPHWLGKVFEADAFIDVIHGSGNGLAVVDDEWLARGERLTVVGTPVLVCPVEEMIWSKSFIMERERFDGADVAHLIRARAGSIDWGRLLRRFGADWRVLLGHLVLFGYIYPAERDLIPGRVLGELVRRLSEESTRAAPRALPAAPVCQGTMLSREQYLADVGSWGYRDARIVRGAMSPDDVSRWTAAIAGK
jgi:hypothetical protein